MAPASNFTINSFLTDSTPLDVLVAAHGGRVDWSPQDKIAYSLFVSGKNGGEIHTINPDGSGDINLTGGRNEISHISNDQPCWSPNGKYVVFQSVDPALYATLPVPDDQKPGLVQGGYGVDNNLWAYNVQTQLLTQLTFIGQAEAVLHPHFSPDGNYLYWASRIMNAGVHGQLVGGAEWYLTLASFVDNAGVPSLTNTKTYQPISPDILYETHNFSPDGRRALFSTNCNPTADQRPLGITAALNIHKFLLSTKQSLQLTKDTNIWNEHAQYAPSGKRIAWISSKGYAFTPVADWQATLKTDLWIMNGDGSGRKQLTFFNTPGSNQYVAGLRVILSDGSWNPAGDKYVMQADYIGLAGTQSQCIILHFNAPQ